MVALKQKIRTFIRRVFNIQDTLRLIFNEDVALTFRINFDRNEIIRYGHPCSLVNVDNENYYLVSGYPFDEFSIWDSMMKDNNITFKKSVCVFQLTWFLNNEFKVFPLCGRVLPC